MYRVTQTRLSVAAAGVAAAFAYLRRWPATRAIAQSSQAAQPAGGAREETVLDLMPAGPPHVVEVLPDGTRRVVFGGLRATVRGAVVRWGDGEFAAAIRVTGHCPRGWIFVAADGAAARSDEFLAPLERLDDVPDGRVIEPEATVTVLSPGRAMFSTYSGAWWTTDGREPLRRVEALPPGLALAAGFVDSDHGALRALYHRREKLYRTDDGGAHWARDRHARKALTAAFAPPAEVDDHAALRRSLTQALWAARPHLTGSGVGVWLADGRTLLDDRDHTHDDEPSFIEVDRHSSRVLGRVGFDAAFGFDLDDPRGIDLDDQLLQIRLPHGVGTALTALPGVNEREVVPAEPLYLADAPAFAPRQTHYAAHLVAYRAPATEREAPVLVRVSTADARVTAYRTSPPTRLALCARALPDVMVSVTGALALVDGARPPHLVHGMIDDEELSVRPLPETARPGVFAVRRRGVAWGAHLGDVWRTLDGGALWERLPLPLDGDPARLVETAPRASPLHCGATAPYAVYRSAADAAPRCDETGCILPGGVVMRGWGPVVRVAVRAIAARTPAVGAAANAPGAAHASARAR